MFAVLFVAVARVLVRCYVSVIVLLVLSEVVFGVVFLFVVLDIAHCSCYGLFAILLARVNVRLRCSCSLFVVIVLVRCSLCVLWIIGRVLCSCSNS